MSLYLISNLSADALSTLENTPEEQDCIVFIGEASTQLKSGRRPLPITAPHCHIVNNNPDHKPNQTAIDCDSRWSLIDMDRLVELTVIHSPIISL